MDAKGCFFMKHCQIVVSVAEIEILKVKKKQVEVEVFESEEGWACVKN